MAPLDLAPQLSPPLQTPAARDVAAVVVRAARLPPAPGDPAFSVIRLDAAALQKEPRLDRALEQVPGLSLFRRSDSLSANPTAQGASLRAIGPSGAGRALVTLDGVPINDPFGGWVIWSAIAPETLSGAQVVRGAGAGPWGAGALTGTIALESRADRTGELLADAEGGDPGYARAAAVTDLAIGQAALSMAASGQTSNGWIPVREGRGPVDTALNFRGGSAEARFDADLGSGGFAGRIAGYSEHRGTGVRGGIADASGSSVSLTWAAQPTPAHDGFRLQAWAQRSDFDQTSLSVAPGRATLTLANDQYATPATGAGINAAWRRRRARWSLEAGVDARLMQGEDRERFRFVGGGFTRGRIAGGRQSVAGAYAEATRVDGPWLATGGLRLDAWRSWSGKRVERDLATGAVTLNGRPADTSGTTPTARAGLRRALGDGWYVRAAAYAGFRQPTLNELHRPFRVGNDVTESNPALRPERLQGAEAGFGRTGAGWSLDADLFVNRLQDPITNVTLGVGPGTFPLAGFIPTGGTFRVRENAGEIRAVGAEADAHVRLWPDRLSARAALSVTDARVHGGTTVPRLDGKRPAQAPIWTATAGVEFIATDRLKLDADARFESRRFEDDQNLRPLKAALTFNARADWRLGSRATLFVRAENLFDAGVQTGAAADGTISWGAPRMVTLGVRLSR